MRFLSQDATVMLEQASKSKKPDEQSVIVVDQLQETVDGLLTCLSQIITKSSHVLLNQH